MKSGSRRKSVPRKASENAPAAASGSLRRWYWMGGIVALALVLGAAYALTGLGDPDWWAAMERPDLHPTLEIQHPRAGAVFPSNMPPPMVLWRTNVPGVDRWLIGLRSQAGRWLFKDAQPSWHVPADDWRSLLRQTGHGTVEVVVAGYHHANRKRLLATGSTRITLSAEAVTSPLFFREVNLPFREAVKDPSRIRWRFGAIDSLEPPPIVLQNLKVCGNCHSFTRNGEDLAMDVDYANSKGSYIITKTGRKMRLATTDIITWDDFRKEDRQQTFGLLSQISPDGRYVLSTVKDQSVFVPRPDLAFSQLFFPIKGIVVVYDRQRKEFAALPGADDPAFVQSNPVWSPDGQTILFARNRAYELKNPNVRSKILLTPDECEEFLKDRKEFRFDLYRVPFNAGKGGRAVPLPGASQNGRSNFFPKFSPDGRWIVFCQASNYMLLQPDSELFILPAEGGQARRLACNLGLMNSWHSWSPDGKWLVFSSKANSLYTQLYLTRIDERGEASPAVWLDRLVGRDRAANIPEFVALAPDAIAEINENFLDDYSYTRAGDAFYLEGETDHAIEDYQKALSLNPNNSRAHQRLGFLLYHARNQKLEGLEHSKEAVRLEPNSGFARYDLGMALLNTGDSTNAIPHLGAALRLLPKGYDSQYNLADMNYYLAFALYRAGQFAEAAGPAQALLRLAPQHPKGNYLMALTMVRQGMASEGLLHYNNAVAANSQLASLPDFQDALSHCYQQQGLFQEALSAAEKARKLALQAGHDQQAAQLQRRIELCRAMLPPPSRR